MMSEEETRIEEAASASIVASVEIAADASVVAVDAALEAHEAAQVAEEAVTELSACLERMTMMESRLLTLEASIPSKLTEAAPSQPNPPESSPASGDPISESRGEAEMVALPEEPVKAKRRAHRWI